jgi:hypothetical protein
LSVIIRSGKRIARRLIDFAALEWHRIVDERALKQEKPRQASDWQWRAVRRCPAPRLDAAGATIEARLYVIGGYRSAADVLNVVDVLDMKTGRWTACWPTPPQMAQSHVAVACDGRRFIYFVSGQLGNHCHPATDRAFALDTVTARFVELPPLPQPRYAATAQLWNGKLHVVGGSMPDRFTPAAEHWSLGVHDGRAVESQWRAQPPIPSGGPHRASAVIDNRLLVFGGQVGDWIAVAGDPDCRCTGENIREQYLSVCFALDKHLRSWTTLRPMPHAVSHTEQSSFVIGSSIYLLGGQCALDESNQMGLTDVIQRYDARLDEWSIVGTLPYRVKTCVAGHFDGAVCIVGGQRDRGPSDARPSRCVSQVWRAELPVDRSRHHECGDGHR